MTEEQLQKVNTYFALETEVKFILNTLKNELLDDGASNGKVIDLPEGAKLVLTKKSACSKKQFNSERFKQEIEHYERFYDTVQQGASVSVKYMGC